MGLSILTWNVRGVMSSSLCLNELLERTNCDIALISEHKLLPHNLEFMNCLNNNYSSYSRSDITVNSYSMLKCGKGGVSVMYKKSLASRIELLEAGNDRIIGIKLTNPASKPYYIFSVYLPSNNYINDYREAISYLQEIFTYYSENGHVVLAGDMNASLSQHNHINSGKSNELRRFVSDNCIKAINSLPGCSGPNYTYLTVKSMIDYILTDDVTSWFVRKCQILSEGTFSSTSDHLPILCEFNVDTNIAITPIADTKWIAWHKATDDGLKEYKETLSERLEYMLDHKLQTASDLNLFESEVVACILKTAYDTLPVKMPSAYTKPYWNENIKILHKKERQERVEWLKAGRPRDKTNVLYSNYKYAKEQFRIAQRSASEDYMEKSINEIQNAAECDIRLFWKLTKKFKHNNSYSNIQLVQDGKVLTSLDMVLNAFETFYSDIYTEKSNPEFDENYKQQIEAKYIDFVCQSFNNFQELLDTDISEHELGSILTNLKKLKAPGWDLIQNEHILYGGNTLRLILLKLYNSIMKLEMVPESWKKGLIIPIYKGQRKSRSDINSYRPVTLLPVFYKVYEKILQSRIINYLSVNSIVFPNRQQQGFQPKLSCISTVFNLQETIQYNIDQGSCTYVAFLDIKKAFDTVWHQNLLVKLHELGICGKLWRIICKLYENMRSAISINRHTSSWFPVEQGVRQGGVLSTLLFLVHNNDLLNDIEKSGKGSKVGSTDCSCPTYVDDIALVANSPANLQTLASTAYRHSCTRRYQVNVDKSCVVIFGTNYRTTHQQISIKLGNAVIPQKRSVTHLGVRQESNRSSTVRTREACTKGRSVFYSMADIGVRPCGLHPDISIDLYKKVVIPTVLYGCEIWNNLKQCDRTELNKFQRMIVKKSQGFHPYVRSDMCEAMVGLFRIQAEVDRRKLLFLRSLCDLSYKTVSNQLFLFKLFMFLDYGIDSGFIGDIIRIMSTYNLQHFLYQYVQTLHFPNKRTWKTVVNKAIYQYEQSQWHQRIYNDSDFTIFRQLQPKVGLASVYVMGKLIKDKTLIVSIAKLWVMKPTVRHTCHLCGKVQTNILTHLVGECINTRQQFAVFYSNVQQHFGQNIARELSSCSAINLLVKLLGLTFATEISQSAVTILGKECFKLMKQLTRGLPLY
ncbi:MAG: reverse transcriptase family protein [Candidatus Thiodiazotropha sp.]